MRKLNIQIVVKNSFEILEIPLTVKIHIFETLWSKKFKFLQCDLKVRYITCS